MGNLRANTADSDSWGIYRRLLGYVLPHWRAFVFSIVSMAIVAATEGGFAWLMKPMMDGSFVERDPEIIKYTPFVLVGIFLIRGLASFISGYWMSWVARKVIKTLRGEMFEQLLRLPVTFYDSTPSGTLLSKLLYNVEQVSQATTSVITILIRDTLSVIGLLFVLFYHSWQLALVLLVGAPAIALLIRYVNRRFRRYSARIQNSMGEITQIAEEAIEGQRVVKTFGGQAYESQRFEEANEHNRHLAMKLVATDSASVPVVQFIAAMAAAGVIYIALKDESMSVGSFVSFVAAMMMLLAPVKRLTQIASSLQRGIVAAASIFEFLDTLPEKDEGRLSIERSQGRVAYEGITFRYNEDKGDVLHDVSFVVEPGQSVAFVGRSGSGKSTLVSLLPRFYDVEQGKISLDGHDIHEIPLDNLRNQIALVTQHITLFNDTIANNIAYGRLEGSSREAIIEAATAAHAMEFIEELPNGLDTMVGENGVLLSGGQRQRLAIARALLKNAPILILDEATSALDTESERAIQSALEELMKNRTTLVIAHRLSTIEKADRIIVMERGRIIESGTHQELLAQGGHYAMLYKMQFRDE